MEQKMSQKVFGRVAGLLISLVIGIVWTGCSAAHPALTLDPTFDTNGKVTTDIGNYADTGRAIALQPDGKIVVAGDAEGIVEGVSFKDFALVRYNIDGSVNTIITTDIGDHTLNFGRAVALQPDGKIVVAGSTAPVIGGTFSVALARYDSAGP
jgi:uncharacterized delta-60 repeat protein